MGMQFAPKVATLVANVQNTLSWGLREFANSLGQQNGVIHDQISVSFQVTNNTAQVCYIGLSYETRTNSFNVSDKKSIAAVPAGSSLNITPLTVPSIAVLGPDITAITMTLISAAAGNVTVALSVDQPQVNAGSGAPLFGLDDRSIQDYILFSMGFPAQTFTGNFSFTIPYTVPAGKRVFIEGFYGYLPQTPVSDGELTIQCNIDTAIPAYYVESSYSAPITFSQMGRAFVIGPGQVISITASQIVGYAKVSRLFSAVMVLREVF